MKFGVLILLLSVVAAAQSLAPGAAMPSKTPPATINPQDANTQKARELINQAIQALGGQAYLNIQDMQQQGRAYGLCHGEANGVAALRCRFWKWPDKDRIDRTKQRSCT